MRNPDLISDKALIESLDLRREDDAADEWLLEVSLRDLLDDAYRQRRHNFDIVQQQTASDFLMRAGKGSKALSPLRQRTVLSSSAMPNRDNKDVVSTSFEEETPLLMNRRQIR
jgi:hypothetical protein